MMRVEGITLHQRRKVDMIQIRPVIILLWLLLMLQDAHAQSKKIENNNAVSDVHQKALLKNLELSDLKRADHEFAFRLWSAGQVIDVTKDSTLISGMVTNYMYHSKTSGFHKLETLFTKDSLSHEQAKAAYQLFQNLRLLNIPTDEKIKEWKKGFDGITYLIEQSDKELYSVKSYWTPSAQDGLAEANSILDFVSSLSDTLNLEETFQVFKRTLPRKGCYHTGGMAVMCYVSNSFWAGYSGAVKLPYGVYTEYNAGYIGNTEVNLSTAVQYNFDRDGFYHLNAALTKRNIFYGRTHLTDYIRYKYQKRKIDIKDAVNKFENHQLLYGMLLKNNFSIGGGIDYLRKEDNDAGAYLYSSKWFSKPNINAALSVSLFEEETNYKIELSKAVYFRNGFFAKGLSLGISYEDFMCYRDVYFNLAVWL